MKKFLSSLLLIALVIAVAGCGSSSDSKSSSSKSDKKEEESKSSIKSLSCSDSQSDEDSSYSFSFTFNYDEDKKEYKDGTVTISMEMKDATSEDIDDLYADAKEDCDSKDYYTSCDVDKTSTKVTQTAKIDLSKFTAYDLKEYDTLEKLKDYVETDLESGSCTIK